MIERFRGALLGFAVGDALGMPVEGMSREEVRRLYGEVTDFLPSPYGDLKAGDWTDDTEQMMTLARSILKTVYFSPDDFAERLKLVTSNRVGPTTRTALKNLVFGVPWNRSGVVSDTCGSAVRVLPIGLVYSFSLDLVEKYAVFSSLITHRGPAIGGAVATAVAVSCVLKGWKKEEIVEEVVRRVNKYDELLADKVELAFEIGDEDVDFAVSRLGNSMSVYDTVPFALYCYLSTSDFRECAIKAVNAGGDSDSIAAIACGLKGCEVGVGGIPKRWIENLRDAEVIRDLADRLHDLYVTISEIGQRMGDGVA